MSKANRRQAFSMTLPESVVADFDWSGRIPVYSQLADRLASAIAACDVLPGALLDSEAQMARQLGLSIETVNHAVSRLVGRGLLVRRRGIGTSVVPTASRNTLTHRPSQAVPGAWVPGAAVAWRNGRNDVTDGRAS
jgi:DNA-binding transcriptional regulator YhcF (GntR family)